MKRQHTKLQILLVGIALSLSSNTDAQNATSNDSRKDLTNDAGWSWSIDDNNNQPDADGFRWWNNGGTNLSQLMMQLKKDSRGKYLEIPTTTENAIFSLIANDQRASTGGPTAYPYIFLQSGNARSSVFFGYDNYLTFSVNPKAPTNASTASDAHCFRFVNSKGAAVTDVYRYPSDEQELMRINIDGNIGIGTKSPLSRLHVAGDLRVQSVVWGNTWDNFIIRVDDFGSYLTSYDDNNGMYLSSNLGNKITVGDDNDEVSVNAKKLILDYGETSADLAQVSINTDKQVNSAALTVAGATYIGAKAELAAAGSLAKFKPEYLTKYSLWVEKGIVSEDFAFASVAAWKDEVFNPD